MTQVIIDHLGICFSVFRRLPKNIFPLKLSHQVNISPNGFWVLQGAIRNLFSQQLWQTYWTASWSSCKSWRRHLVSLPTFFFLERYLTWEREDWNFSWATEINCLRGNTFLSLLSYFNVRNTTYLYLPTFLYNVR